MEDRFFSVPEARTDLGNIGRTKLYELVSAGDLELVKLGRKSLITGRSIARFKARLIEQLAALAMNRNDPRAGSARAVERLLGGDVHGLSIAALRTGVLAARLHLNPDRATLIAGLALGEARHV